MRERQEVQTLLREAARPSPAAPIGLRAESRRATVAPLTLARQRPHYVATDRHAILELQAAHGWSMQRTADEFLVDESTIRSWHTKLDSEDGLLVTVEPVNKFPDAVRQVVQKLKQFFPMLGKHKIADILTRAGLHLSVSTAGRILREPPIQDPEPAVDGDTTESEDEASAKPDRVVTANYSNHVWNIDLTVVPIGGGFWVPWFSFTLPQIWPFCWWVAVVMDHYSRKIVGFEAYFSQPSSEQA